MTRSIFPAALCALAVGCSGMAVTDADCLSVGCPAPYVCREPTDPGATPACSSSELGIPECRGAPVDSPLPISTTEGGIPYHHVSPATCVPITVSGAAAGFQEEIDGAISAFAAIACTSLCFRAGGLSEVALQPSLADRRIHVRVASEAELAENEFAASDVYFELANGRIIGCEVLLDAGLINDLDVGEALNLIMQCSGFSPSTDPEQNTVLRDTGNPGSRPTELTPDDEAALCAFYGMPSYCAGDDDFLP